MLTCPRACGRSLTNRFSVSDCHFLSSIGSVLVSLDLFLLQEKAHLPVDCVCQVWELRRVLIMYIIIFMYK